MSEMNHAEVADTLSKIKPHNALARDTVYQVEALKEAITDERRIANGELIKLPCKVAESIDRLFSHNEIIALWHKRPRDTQNSYLLWRGMAWDLPKEYKDLRLIRVFGVISEKISESDTVNLLVTPLVRPAYESRTNEKALSHD